MYEIQITFTVGTPKSTNEAKEVAIDVCNHIYNTFNDNDSIGPSIGFEVEKINLFPKKRK